MSKRFITPDEMRAVQLEMMDGVHAFCQEHGIRYSLCGGSLLGAVRHQGFIPWDDDVDILMPRPDYERFLELWGAQQGAVRVQSYRNCEAVCMTFAKLYDCRTVLQEPEQRSGVYIDVFPVEGMPAREELSRYRRVYNEVRKQLARSTRFYQVSGSPLAWLRWAVFRTLQLKREYAVQLMDDFFALFPYERSEFAGAVSGLYGEREHLPRAVFEEYILLPFEGREYCCLKNYDAYLSSLYGDYMKLPPVEQRKPHHVYRAWWVAEV